MALKSEENKPDSRPLYAQVRDLISSQILSGTWQPGDVLPNEFELAKRYGVSQGTVRKALDALAADQLLVRQQGRGTFVSMHTSADVLFRFFQFRDPSGQRVQPTSRTVRTTHGKATSQECEKLALDSDARVIRHTRLRLWRERPFIYEFIVLPEFLFPGLGERGDLPNTLYDMFQKQYGITVARADEMVSTSSAGKREARALNIDEHAPLLRIDRQTVAIDGRIIEWRLSLCHLDGLQYAVQVS